MAEQQFTPIRVVTLRGDLKIPFDVYVKVAGKFIHYCRAGESFEGKRLERLKAKKLKKMFVRTDDEIPYAQYLEESIDSAYDLKSNKTLEVRAEVIQGFQMAAADQFMEDTKNELTYNHVRSSAQRFTEFLEKFPAAGGALLRLENSDSSITHHCVNVSALTTMMVANSDFKGDAKLIHLALGCMVHDIDQVISNVEPKPLQSMTKEERIAYHEHPKNGVQHLQGLGFIDQVALNVILQHEEHMDGSGFPKGITEKEIDPLVQIVSTANAYDRLVSFEKLTYKEAAKSMTIDKMGKLPLPLIQSLQRVLKNLGMV